MAGAIIRVCSALFCASVGGCAAAMAGCASTATATSKPFDSGSLAEAYVAERAPPPGNDIRIHSIQRLADGDSEALIATVSVRNVGSAARTVRVSVAWLARDGSAIPDSDASHATIILAPQETRQVTFTGVADARDFKVSLAYPGT